MTTDDLVHRLRAIVGRRAVLIDPARTARYRIGYRFGEGAAECVVRPATLVALWRVLQACVAANRIVILQAANTGLTGGSTPHGKGYDRPVVIINTLKIDGIHLVREGAQAICLAGATLDRLGHVLAAIGREPHSVIGSSCIGASVVGGICNSSGGTLIQRGPAYTEMALFAALDADGVLRLVNHLGVELGDTPEDILDRLDRGDFTDTRAPSDEAPHGSRRDYADRLRDVDSAQPCRFNADPRGLYEASGSAGRVAVLAVRVDTFPREAETAVFYIGTNDPAELTELRRHMLGSGAALPIAAEYIHRTAFDIAARYGKDTFLAIERFGVDRLPRLFALKAGCDRLAARFGLGAHPGDRLLQAIAGVLPQHLPARIRAWRDRFEHHLLLKVGGDAIAETADHLAAIFPSRRGDMFRCTPAEAAKAFLHRFAVAGAAVRYRALHSREIEEIVALDVALRANDRDWFDPPPPAIAPAIAHALHYGHFFCHVFHRDYLIRKGHDATAVEHALHARLDARGARYPAEHNVGHHYPAPPELEEFYRTLDPSNSFNPGIGQTSRRAYWRTGEADEAA